MRIILFLCFMSGWLLIGCNSSNDYTLSTSSDVQGDLHYTNRIGEPKVTGIGGIFFTSDNPGETKEWYQKNLGIQTDDYGAVFESRGSDTEHLQYLRWSLFDSGTEYFLPSSKEFMINYRVQNIEGLVKQLRENDVNVLDSIVSFDYGKFIHLMDPDGNKIELWEPVDSVLTKISTATNK